jgi:2-methylisocitrate lyase-like PEP mutase family enzyme
MLIFKTDTRTTPEDVAENVSHCVSTGVAGLSIEDSTGIENQPLYDFDLAVERIRAARSAIDVSGFAVRAYGPVRGLARR